MKITFTICILPFFFIARNSPAKNLIPVIEHYNKKNFIEIDSLINFAQKNLNINFSVAYNIANRAKTLAIASQYTKAIIESTCIISKIQAKTNKCGLALNTINALLPLAEKTNDTLSIGKIYATKAICYYYSSEYDSCEYFDEGAIDFFEKINAGNLILPAYQLLAKTLIKRGEIKKAGMLNAKAMNAFEKTNNEEGKAWSFDIAGEIYHAQRLYAEAIIEYQKSCLLFKQLNHLAGIASANLHQGGTYYALVQDDSAKKNYNLALANYSALGDSNGIAMCYSNLSRISLEASNYPVAIKYAENAITIVHNGNYNLIEASTLQQLGDIYAELHQFDKAILYVNKSLEMALKIDHKVTVMDCYKSLSEIYEAMKKSDSSYKYLLLSYHLKDSIQPLAFSKQLGAMQAQYETEKKESQIKLLNQNNLIKTLALKEQNSQIKKRNIFIVSGLLIFILIAVAVYYASQKQKLKNVLEKEFAIKVTEENERLRFAKDIHDDLGSELSKISFLSELIFNSKNEIPEIKKSASAIADTAKKLVENMRDLIWALNPENATLDNLLSRIREYSSDYLEDYSAEIKLKFPEHVSSSNISKESQREIFMTIKECLNNIVKHSQATNIEIESTISNSFLSISFKDNGVGIADEKTIKGNGLRNMKSRIASVGGIFNLKSDLINGTLIVLTIPMDNILKS